MIVICAPLLHITPSTTSLICSFNMKCYDMVKRIATIMEFIIFKALENDKQWFVMWLCWRNGCKNSDFTLNGIGCCTNLGGLVEHLRLFECQTQIRYHLHRSIHYVLPSTDYRFKWVKLFRGKWKYITYTCVIFHWYKGCIFQVTAVL